MSKAKPISAPKKYRKKSTAGHPPDKIMCCTLNNINNNQDRAHMTYHFLAHTTYCEHKWTDLLSSSNTLTSSKWKPVFHSAETIFQIFLLLLDVGWNSVLFLLKENIISTYRDKLCKRTTICNDNWLSISCL